MTVFLAHAPADREAAEALEKVLERRGQFVETDDGRTALRPVQTSDVYVLLVSKDLVFAPTRLRLEQRALDAWSDGRLLVVKLDHGIAPVGLRDLPAIDASFEAQREFAWQKVADAVREQLSAPQPEGETAQPDAPAKKKGGALFKWALGAVALVAVATPLLSVQLQSTAGDLVFFGIQYTWLQFGVAVASAFAFVILAALVTNMLSRLGRRRARPTQAPQSQGADAVFVSYARANSTMVLPVIEAAQAEGRKFWFDQQGLNGGENWAGEIVRAIRGAAGVMVMCSKAAFESDHVKREVYLADRYRKKLVPVFIEQAEPPEDFEYFFANLQSLNLFETPEAERPQALMRALGTS